MPNYNIPDIYNNDRYNLIYICDVYTENNCEIFESLEGEDE